MGCEISGAAAANLSAWTGQPAAAASAWGQVDLGRESIVPGANADDEERAVGRDGRDGRMRDARAAPRATAGRRALPATEEIIVDSRGQRRSGPFYRTHEECEERYDERYDTKSRRRCFMPLSSFRPARGARVGEVLARDQWECGSSPVSVCDALSFRDSSQK